MAARKIRKKTDPQDDALPTRDKILNAAERLFAERGYYGVTIREITSAAGVDVALASYYFGPKNELFSHVLMRRAEEHMASILASLDHAAQAAGDRPPTVEAIIDAWARPVMQRLMHGGDGWRNYIHLLAYLSNSQQQQAFLEPMQRLYDPVMRRVLALLRQALPSASDARLACSFYLVMGSLIHMFSETGGVDRLTGGLCKASDFDRILAHLAPFFAAGFYRMAAAKDP